MSKIATTRNFFPTILLAIATFVGALATSSVQGQSPDRSPGADVKAITQVMQDQAAAWNRADIDGFMAHYWKSVQLTFSSGGKTKRGWQATIDGYKRRYPTPEKMGTLKFTQLEVFSISSDAAYVLGRWSLARTEPIGGNFSLIFRRIDGRWVIVHDHTSAQEPTENTSAIQETRRVSEG